MEDEVRTRDHTESDTGGETNLSQRDPAGDGPTGRREDLGRVVIGEHEGDARSAPVTAKYLLRQRGST
jgi:hypothetical protein